MNEPVIDYKDGGLARKAFARLPSLSQLVWALMLKRVAQQSQYRGIEPRGVGLRAQARARGYSNNREYAAYLRRQEFERQLREQEQQPPVPAPIAESVNAAFQ